MSGLPFYLTDVFILEGYSGNQLATLIPARALSARQMQSIARELNFSETTFVTGGDTKQGFHTRIFTPTEEELRGMLTNERILRPVAPSNSINTTSSKSGKRKSAKTKLAASCNLWK